MPTNILIVPPTPSSVKWNDACYSSLLLNFLVENDKKTLEKHEKNVNRMMKKVLLD